LLRGVKAFSRWGAAASACVACSSTSAPARLPTVPDVCLDKMLSKGELEELSRRCNSGGDLQCLYQVDLVATVEAVARCPDDRRLLLRATAASDLQGSVIGVIHGSVLERPTDFAQVHVGDVVHVRVNGTPILKGDKTLLDPARAQPISPAGDPR
jgi:hypothetical protein